MRCDIWIKICGIKDIKTAKFIEELKFSAIGLNFYNKSKRYIDPESAKTIASSIKIKKVGIFVNNSYEEIKSISDFVGLDLIQLHGDESAKIIEKLGAQRVIKVIPADDNLKENISFFSQQDIFAILIDTPTKKFGGSGKIFDWNKLKEIDANRTKIIVAGGLNPDNFSKIFRYIKPFGLDFNSGLENKKGSKDFKLIKKLHKNLEKCHE